MKDVYDFAKYFIKKGADSSPNTYDGNMKLQKLLTFADLISIAKYGKPLFSDPALAFKNGCVFEKVRQRYKNDYSGLKKDSDMYQPDFSEEEYDVLGLALSIFGNASAKELSEINHTFDFWRSAYENGICNSGYHCKELSTVNMLSQKEDIERMKDIISAYEESANNATEREVINGVTFYYDGFKLTDEIIDQLEAFSLNADDDCYTVYMDDGKLVIY